MIAGDEIRDRAAGSARSASGRWLAGARALRPHQWSKNLLVFVPAVAGHRFSVAPFAVSALAFLCFCGAASSGYLVNDLLDAPSDRAHAVKNSRPLASGALSPRATVLTAAGLAILSIAGAAAISRDLTAVVVAYLLLSLAYSLILKRRAILDVIVLATLFTLRVIGGSAATGIPASNWLLMFSLFLFLGLSLAKRCSEIAAMRGAGDLPVAGRGYSTRDLPALTAMGVAAGYASALVFAIYVGSPEVRLLYHHVDRLWFALPMLIYWISRVLLLASRGELDEDPIVFAIGDPTTWLVGTCLAGVFAVSI